MLHAEATPEDGFYFRSDHFNFAKAGVPALYAKGGDDLVEGGAQPVARRPRTTRRTATTSLRRVRSGLEPGGTMQDLDALYGVGRELADGDHGRTGTRAIRSARRASSLKRGAGGEGLATRAIDHQIRHEGPRMTIATAYWCV